MATRNNNDHPSKDFSMTASISDPGSEERQFNLAANEDERRQIAQRLDVLSVDLARGDLTLRPLREGFEVIGDVEAHVTRRCVVSLEAMDEKIAERFSIQFLKNMSQADLEDNLEDNHFVEPLEQDIIDLGDILVQQISLALAPHPRKTDADKLIDQYAPKTKISPFTVLKGLESGGD